MLNITEDAWQRQYKLKKKYVDVPDTKEIVDIINSIDAFTAKQTIRNRALFAMYYLTGCRLSEITKCLYLVRAHYQNKNLIERWKEKHDYLGIRKKNITIEVIDEKECMHIRTENRKNPDKTTKKQPIPISKEKDIATYVTDYLKIINDEDILFNFTPKRAIQIINKTGFNVHFIRHIRATHLVTKYDFNEQLLIKFMGWSDARPAKSYMELNTKDMFRQFFKNE